MAYLDSSRRTSPASMAAVVAIHAAIGIGLIAGLTVTGTIISEKPDWPDHRFPGHAATPTQPRAAAERQKPGRRSSSTSPSCRRRRLDLGTITPPIDTTTIIIPAIPDAVPSFTPSPRPAQRRAVSSQSPPAPRNDPASWVSNSDYRSEWARREWTGRASFRLAICGGRSGNRLHHHLLQRAWRARYGDMRPGFQARAFRSGAGEGWRGGRGSYAGTIVWQLPD